MALTVSQTPVQGSTSLSGGSLQGNTSVGQQAISPTSNLSAPTNTLSSTQVAPKDLSNTYTNIGGTIFNKQSNTAFSNQADFFKDSGLTSFNNVKFDTSGGWTPNPTTTIYGGTQLYQAGAPKPAQLASSSTPAPTAPPTNTSGLGGPYTPTNQGTSGVAQGGIIGNLINTAQTQNPNYTSALTKLNSVSAQQRALEEQAAQGNADIKSRPMGLTQQTGQQGIFAGLLASKEAALAPEYNAAAAALGAANTQTSNSNAALSSAGNLNSPQFVTPGQFQVSPSQTVPGGIVGGNSALNPLSQISSLAQQVVAGTKSYSDALAAGGNVPGFNSALSQAITQLNPGFNFNTSQGNTTAQQTTASQQAQLQATYTSSKQQANNLTSQFSNLLQTYGLNPNEINIANGVIQTIAANTSDARYQALKNYITDIANTYSSILGAGGTITNDVRDTAQGMLDSLASGQSIQATLQALDQQAQAKISGVQTAPITNSQTTTNSQTLGLF